MKRVLATAAVVLLAGCGEPMRLPRMVVADDPRHEGDDPAHGVEAMRLPRMVVADDPVFPPAGTVGMEGTDWAIVARRNRHGWVQPLDEDEWEPEGRWAILYADGTEAEGSYVDGKREGHWAIRYQAGTATAEGPYVDGERNGHWVVKRADGTVPEVSIVDDEGRWVVKWADVIVLEAPIVDFEMRVSVKLKWTDGIPEEGAWESGSWEFSFPYHRHRRYGHWVLKRADGTVEEGPIVKDKTNRWVLKWADGSCEVVKFKAGVRVNTTDC